MQYVGTLIQELRKLYAANVTAASITALIPTVTEPTGDGIYDPTNEHILPNHAWLQFFGTRSSADNETFTARLSAWRRYGTLWVPTPLLVLTLTQGTSVGVANAGVVATEYFADTIVVSSAFLSDYGAVSPADNSIGGLWVDLKGARKLQVQLARGTNASCNALVCGF